MPKPVPGGGGPSEKDYFIAAIGQQESGGNYHAVNPGTGALGKYQVMPSNLAPWLRECGLKVISPNQYLNDPPVQDQLAYCILGGYYDRYGPYGAASMWYSGQPDWHATYGDPPVYVYVGDIIAIMHRLMKAGGLPVPPQPKPSPQPSGKPIIGQPGGLLGWLINQLGEPFKSILKWVNTAFDAVISWVRAIWDNLGRELNQFARNIQGFSDRIWAFAGSIYNLAVWITKVALPDLRAWVNGLWHNLSSYADWIWSQVTRWVRYLLAYIDNAVSNAYRWVINNVWKPLDTRLTGAINWITGDGYFIYRLVTHPDLLSAWLGKWLWSSWIELLTRYSKPIARWLLHSMMSLEGELVTVVEDFITNLL